MTDTSKDQNQNLKNQEKEKKVNEIKEYKKDYVIGPVKRKTLSTRTVKELKEIILAYRPTFLEESNCMLEEIENHYKEHGYKPEEQGYITLRYVFGKLKVFKRACLVLLLINMKQDNRIVKIKWERPFNKKTDYPTHGRR
tara:strand:+ start:29 stop:448 length:420 start_codon:yes stop_codon:yes gene_type:complete